MEVALNVQSLERELIFCDKWLGPKREASNKQMRDNKSHFLSCPLIAKGYISKTKASFLVLHRPLGRKKRRLLVNVAIALIVT